jgi:glycosyltransferase involved in cell wall biosynthesis
VQVLPISVVICAYTERRWDDLLAAIASVQQQSSPPFEVIVVVDHNDDLLERLRAHMAAVNGSAVNIVANTQSRGLAGARNTGVALATGAVVAFIDDDAVADTDWLKYLGAAYEHDGVLGVGGAIEPVWQHGRPAWFPAEFDWVVGCTYRGMPEFAGPVRNLIGANMSFRRDVFDVVGGFNEGVGRVGAVPLGCEETEICIRAGSRWPGRSFRYEPQARVHHQVPADRGRWSYFRARCYGEGLSKAAVSRLAGATRGLESERAYVRRTLPRGVVRGLNDGMRADRSGLRRAGAIMLGLATTTAGYARGRIDRRVQLPAPEIASHTQKGS